MITVVSEKVQELIEGVENGKFTEAYCLDVIKSGTLPIIEEREGYSKYVWVTHFYIGEAHIENVVLYEPHIAFNPERAIMDRIEGTKIFWKTTLVPYDFKLKYAFSVNDSLLPTCAQRTKQLLIDPLNPLNTEVENLLLSWAQTPIHT